MIMIEEMSVLLGMSVPRVWPLTQQRERGGIRMRDANCGGYSPWGGSRNPIRGAFSPQPLTFMPETYVSNLDQFGVRSSAPLDVC
jgi:hypothetical protein